MVQNSCVSPRALWNNNPSLHDVIDWQKQQLIMAIPLQRVAKTPAMVFLFRYLLCLSTYLPIYMAKRVIKY